MCLKHKHQNLGYFSRERERESKRFRRNFFVKTLFSLFLFFSFLFFVTSPVHAATLFSDDFNDNSIDATKWIEVEYNSQDNITETGGKVSLNGSGGAWGRTALFSQTNFTRAANTTFIATVNQTYPYVIYGFKEIGIFIKQWQFVICIIKGEPVFS